MINERHYSRLKGLLDDARSKGARVVEVGRRPEEATSRPHTLAPTVVLGATDSMQIMREEIFGPILPIISYHIGRRTRPFSAPAKMALHQCGARYKAKVGRPPVSEPAITRAKVEIILTNNLVIEQLPLVSFLCCNR